MLVVQNVLNNVARPDGMGYLFSSNIDLSRLSRERHILNFMGYFALSVVKTAC